MRSITWRLPMTSTDRNQVFKMAAFLKSNISQEAQLMLTNPRDAFMVSY